MLFASYFVVFTSIRSIFPTLRSKEVLGSWFLVLSLILSTISLYHTLILKYVNRASEGVSFMWIYYGHNHLSALLLFAIPIAFYLIKKYWKTKRLNALLFITCYVLLVTLFFTLARAAMLSLFVASLLSFLVFPNIIARQGRVILLIGIIFTLAVLLFGILASNRSFPTYRGAMPLNENNSRIVYWKQAISNFQKHPLFGSGLDTFRIINKRSPQPKGIPGSYFVHNFFLQILSDTGIFGFLSSIGLIGSVLWKSVRRVFEIRNSQKALLLAFWVGLLATTLNTMVDFDWQLPVVFLIFWIFAGFLTSKHV
jgi:O-antigen ligase